MIQSFTKYGYSFRRVVAADTPSSFTSSDQIFAITQDSTNSSRSSLFPNDCYISTIEFQFDTLSTATSVTMYVTRDSNGDVPLTPGVTSGATQTITTGVTTATAGGAVFTVDTDFHFDDSVSNATSGTIYVIAKVDAGTPTGKIRVNWRS
jgi:hypothetical protein